ncbi:hypothetical protein M405DRAFT_936769 [Rhizopogon salebrosus TDB-379]|nr:hypothetical protein M405DRAFT_936769 [Rhizopogon salebrosus TDB-379]
MGSKAEFIEVDNRIRSLTTILNNFNHRVSPSSDPNGHPSLLHHFANLLSTGHKNSPDAGKVVAVTGLLLPDGKTSALVVAQDPSSKSDTPEQNELSQDPRWFRFPRWLNFIKISPEQRKTMKTRNGGAPGRELIEVEFSNATLGFWAWLLGMSLSNMKTIVETADSKRSKNDGQGFREDLGMIGGWCLKLDFFTGWSACIVETLLTRTSLARAFGLRVAAQPCREYDDKDADYDMSREPGKCDGHLVLRHLRAILAWSTALHSLASGEHLSIINGELDIGLLQFPHDGQDDISGINVITYEFFRRFPVNESIRIQDTAMLKWGWNLGPEFTGTMHAEAMLMGLLTYFSEPDPSSRVDHWDALRDSKIAERMEDLIGPAVATANKAIGVGKKCCWYCSTLGTILQDKYVSIERGSHGIIYPWSSPRFGLDVSVLRKLEDRLWDELHRAIERVRPLASTRRTSFCDDMRGIVWKKG